MFLQVIQDKSPELIPQEGIERKNYEQRIRQPYAYSLIPQEGIEREHPGSHASRSFNADPARGN